MKRLLCLLLLALTAPRPSWPCSLIPEPLAAPDPAEWVFVGTVVAIEQPANARTSSALVLDVTEVISGRVPKTQVRVVVWQLGTDCAVTSIAPSSIPPEVKVGSSVAVIAQLDLAGEDVRVELGADTELGPAAQPPSPRLELRRALAALAREAQEEARVRILRGLVPYQEGDLDFEGAVRRWVESAALRDELLAERARHLATLEDPAPPADSR